jgi:hypothetical protein
MKSATPTSSQLLRGAIRRGEPSVFTNGLINWLQESILESIYITVNALTNSENIFSGRGHTFSLHVCNTLSKNLSISINS